MTILKRRPHKHGGEEVDFTLSLLKDGVRMPADFMCVPCTPLTAWSEQAACMMRLTASVTWSLVFNIASVAVLVFQVPYVRS